MVAGWEGGAGGLQAQDARGPVSRVLSRRRYPKGDRIGGGSHSSGPWIAPWLEQPTRASRGETPLPPSLAFRRRKAPIWPCSGWGLPCRFRCRSRGALLPHPFTLACSRKRDIGGLLSVALSLDLRPAGVTRHPCFVEPGLSSRPKSRGCPAPWRGRLTLAVALMQLPYRVAPRSRSSRSWNRIARISPSITPSIRCGRQRRWNASTALV